MLNVRPVATLVLLFALLPTLALAERQGRLVGRIVDPAGQPIPGVNVTVTSPDIPGFKQLETTDKKGIFTVDFDRIEVTYQYKFEKTGYQSVEARQLWSKEGSEMYDWTMPLASAEAVPAGSAPPPSASVPAIETFNSGMAALKAKSYAVAEAKFREAVAHDPNLRQAWESLSASQFELGRDESAAASAEKAIALGSTQESVYLTRWKAYRRLGNEAKTSEALKDLEKVGRRTEEAKGIHNEAVALAKAGDQVGAFAKFQEALVVDSNLQSALLGLATAGVKIGRHKDALAAAESILKDDPKNEAAVRIRYNAALGLGDKAKIVDALTDLAAYEPRVARDGILGLAFEAYDVNDSAQAKDRFAKVIRLDPNYPQPYYYLGVIYAAEGTSAEARKNLERFLQLAPKDPEADSARDMLKYLK